MPIYVDNVWVFLAAYGIVAVLFLLCAISFLLSVPRWMKKRESQLEEIRQEAATTNEKLDRLAGALVQLASRGKHP